MGPYTVVYIEDGSHCGHRPDSFNDVFILHQAVYLGKFPVADPAIPNHMILVPLANLDGLCQNLMPYGWDAIARVDCDGHVFFTDNAGQAWYRARPDGRNVNAPVQDQVSNGVRVLEIAPKVMSEPVKTLPSDIW